MPRPLLLAVVILAVTFAWAAVSAGATPEDLLKKSRAVLAQLEGEIVVAGLKEPVEVLRDRWGVPHIYARNQDDLFFAQGFVAAQDRLFQMDWWRRVQRGETAEVLGPSAVEADRFSRLVRYRGDMAAEWSSYSPDTQRIATAFTAGINAYIGHLGDRLPIEFQLLGYRPGKWEPEDCLGRMAGVVMSSAFRSEVARAELIAAVGLEKARLFAPADPPHPYAPAPGLDLTGINRSILAGYTAATKSDAFAVKSGGSNNWVVDGTLSASGKPMLANDPHRALTLPALRYLVHLHAPGWNVIGGGEPGLPGVAIGHNDRIAWGMTIVGTDQADLYVEETDAADPTKYRVGDHWESMKVEKGRLSVRGQAPADYTLLFTRHGPVLHHDLKRHRAYALRWAGSEPGGAGYLGCLALDRAENWKGFLTACMAWKVPGENLVYADVDGNIGWIAAALTPIRKGWDGMLPVPGAGAYEWQGFLKVKDLPQCFNPSSHYIATANHNILPPGYTKEISYDWAAPYRFLRIRQRFEGKKQFDVEDFKSIQHDVTTLPGKLLARLAKQVKSTDPNLRPYLDLMSGWDGVLTRDSRAGMLYAIWLRELAEDYYRTHVPQKQIEFLTTRGGIAPFIEALEKADRAWFGDDPIVARDQLLARTLIAAVDKARKLAPGDESKLSWGRLHTATFRHPLGGRGPELAKAFNLGPVPTPGDALTPNAASMIAPKFEHVAGASYRQIFDLADWDRGVATSVPGQSGQPGSPHYADLLPLWEKGEYFPLAFSRQKVEAVTRNRLTLNPAPAPKAAAWKEAKTIRLDGFEVSLSEPVLVARDKGFLWFATLVRRNGDLLALMSNYADVHTRNATNAAAWSTDGGLTWSKLEPALASDSHVRLTGGDCVLLPYYMYPRPGGMGAPYQLIPRGKRELKTVESGVTITGWPRPDRSFDAKVGMSGFVFNGQTVRRKDSSYLATIYGYFKDDKRYSLVAVESTDGVAWKVGTVIAGADCKLKGAEGPCESAMCRLKDSRLMCVFRLNSGVAYGQTWSSDEGKTWTEAVAMDGPFSVQPSLAVLADGTVVLSGGRPGLFVWLNEDGDGKSWQKIDLQAHHNACQPKETIDKANHTSSYTEVVALDALHLLCIYDRIPHGWSAIPAGSADTNSVWVVRITLTKRR